MNLESEKKSSSTSTNGRLKIFKHGEGLHRLEEYIGSSHTGKVTREEIVFRYGWSRFNITVEPLNFSLLFVITFTGGVSLDLIQRNSCNYFFHRNDDECYENLNMTEQILINAEVAEINMVINLAGLVTPAILCLFIGPWSESNGRKPFIIITFIGNTLSFLFAGILSFHPTMNPHYLIMSAIPQALSGGSIGMLICCHCYLCDTFPSDLRTFRFNMFFASALLGGLLANTIVTAIFKSAGEYGFQVVYFTSAIISALTSLYAVYCIPETVKRIKRSWIFDLTHLKEIVDLIIKRSAMDLLVVFFCILVLMSAGIIMAGEEQIEFLVGKAEFDWTLANHNIFSGSTAVVSVLSTGLGSLILKHHFHLRNTTIIFLSASVLAIAEVLRTISKSELFFWISSCLMKHFTIIAPTAHSEMSKHVDYEDLGKLFSFTALIDSLSNFAAGPMYTAVYDKLVYSDRSLLTFSISAIIGVVIVVSSILIRLLTWKKEKIYEVNNIKV